MLLALTPAPGRPPSSPRGAKKPRWGSRAFICSSRHRASCPPSEAPPWLRQADGIHRDLTGAESGLPGGAGGRLRPLHPCPWPRFACSVLKQVWGEAISALLRCSVSSRGRQDRRPHRIHRLPGPMCRHGQRQQPEPLLGAAAPAPRGINWSPGKGKTGLRNNPAGFSLLPEPRRGLGQGKDGGPLSPTCSASPRDHRCPHALACRR